LIGAEKWQGIIRRNGQSAAILSTQSLTCGSRQVTFISLNGYYYAVLACSVDFALSGVGCKCWRIRACLVCYHTSPGHRCGRVWITTLSWELFGWAFMLGSHRTCTLYSRYHRLYSHHRVRRAIPPPPTVASHTLPHAWRGFLWSASKQPLSDLAPLHQATNHMRLCSQFERGLMYNFRNIRKSTGRVRSFDKYLEHSVL